MAGPLFYQATRRWRTAVAFAGAILIHCGAIVIAGIQQHEPISGPGLITDEFPTILLEPHPSGEEPTPPDMTGPLPTPEPANEALFPEKRPTPVPIQQRYNKPVRPIQKVRITQTHGLQASLSAKVLAINAPRPEYPYEARRQKITGEGIVVMTVDAMSGGVTDVTMLKSTGSAVLDNAALTGFRRWRFKQGTASKVRVPITFTMMGAQY